MRTSLLRICGCVLSAAPVTAQLLGPPTTVVVSTPDPLEFVSVADMNGDGRPDAVVAAAGANVVTCLGDGLGGLGAGLLSPTALGLVTRIAMCDVGGDGRLDLVVNGVFLGELQICNGDGDGTFTGAGFVPGMYGKAVGVDWNGDGRTDLVSVGNNVLLAAYGLAGGGFAPLAAIPLPPGMTLFSSTGSAVGDVDGDGHLDLVVGQLLGYTGVLFGDGQGHIVGGYNVPQSLQIEVITVVALADLDHDRDLDLVTRNAFGGLRVLKNEGGGLFLSASPVAGGGVRPVTAVDMDGDGHVDLVTGSDPNVVVLRGDGTGAFAPPETYFAGPTQVVAVGDLDLDGRPDVVAAGSGEVHVLRNLQPTPPGIAAYGSGTAACGGRIGTWGTPEPAIGESTFRVLCSNAPPNAVGLLAMGTRVANGWDPLGIGLTWHLGFTVPVAVMRSDAGGAAMVPLPIPNVPWLAGLDVHVQSLWMADPRLGNTCSPAMYEFASSRGLRITLQP